MKKLNKEKEMMKDKESEREKKKETERDRKNKQRDEDCSILTSFYFLFLNISSILLFIFFALLTGRYNSQEARRDLKKNTENKQQFTLAAFAS